MAKNILMSLFVHKIEGVEPRIVALEQPLQIMGMAMETSMSSIYRDVPQLGKQFEKYKREHEIPNKRQPWAFAAVSKDFDQEAGTFSYIIGDVVTRVDETPAELMTFEIPAIEYAVFPVRPKNRFGWGMAIANMKRYAYTVWLPSSEYEPAGIIDDFEYHDERSTRKRDPEIDLYIAIRKR